jgi:hypothetical protein
VPRKVDDDCLQELRRFYDRRDLAEVRRDIAQWLAKWQTKYPKLCNWVEDKIDETLTYYPLPLQHRRRDPDLGGCDEILAHVLVVQDIDHNIGHDGGKQGAGFYIDAAHNSGSDSTLLLYQL